MGRKAISSALPPILPNLFTNSTGLSGIENTWPLKRTIKGTTLWLSPPAPKVERFFYCVSSHQTLTLCDSFQIVAFIITKSACYYNLIISKMQEDYFAHKINLRLTFGHPLHLNEIPCNHQLTNYLPAEYTYPLRESCT